MAYMHASRAYNRSRRARFVLVVRPGRLLLMNTRHPNDLNLHSPASTTISLQKELWHQFRLSPHIMHIHKGTVIFAKSPPLDSWRGCRGWEIWHGQLMYNILFCCARGSTIGWEIDGSVPLSSGMQARTKADYQGVSGRLHQRPSHLLLRQVPWPPSEG